MKTIMMVIGLVALIAAASATTPVQLSGTNLTEMHQMIDVAKTPDQVATDGVANAFQTVALQQIGVANAKVTIDSVHIGVTLEPSSTATTQTLNAAVTSIITEFAGYVKATGFSGLLRIGIWQNGKMTSVIEVPNNVNMITQTNYHQYISDGYGDITKTVVHDGTIESPSVGDWL